MQAVFWGRLGVALWLVAVLQPASAGAGEFLDILTGKFARREDAASRVLHLAYGPSEQQEIDLYLPQSKAAHAEGGRTGGGYPGRAVGPQSGPVKGEPRDMRRGMAAAGGPQVTTPKVTAPQVASAQLPAQPASPNVPDVPVPPASASPTSAAGPAAIAQTGRPILIIVHGGSWYTGDKRSEGLVENKLQFWGKKGYVVASVNYRLYPDADPLAQARDVASAIAFIQGNARRHDADPDRIVVIGHSAGAHLVGLLSADPSLAGFAGARPWRASILVDSAALDVPSLMAHKHTRIHDEIFGSDPAYWVRTSPLEQLKAESLPMLLVCSLKRQDKPCEAAYAMAARLKAMGKPDEVLAVNLGHRDIDTELGSPGVFTQSVDAFIEAHLR